METHARAVLAADVVSYTRLMEATETATHWRFRNLRVSVIDPAVVSFRGSMVKNTGDGFIAVFESPVDAIRCAVEMQRDITASEASQPPERRIVFRMGLHWQPIIFDIDDVYGAGVNIAVRLQEASSAGGILVSSALVRQAGALSGIILEDVGELSLKNLARPVRASSIVLPGVSRDTRRGELSAAFGNARLPSVAVLPFANLSSEPRDSVIALGFGEDIVASLSNVPELFVVSRGSALCFGTQPAHPAAVSEKLGVRYFLGGSLRRFTDRLRVSVEFMDATEDAVLWAERYDIAIDDIFNLQDEIAIRIVTKITTSVQRSEMMRALRVPPQNLNAYDSFLRGLDLLYTMDFQTFSQARGLLEQAREEDPGYASAYAYSALWYIFSIAEGWSLDGEADAAELIRLSKRAIELDPSNALALALQGHGRAMFYREHDAAIDLFDRALAASPSNAWAWVLSSGTYGFIGQPLAGIARAEQAIRLSPLDNQAFFNFCLLAQNHYLNGSHADAVRWARKSLSLNDRFGNAARVLVASLAALGRMTEAGEAAVQHGRMLPGFRVSDYARRCPFVAAQADKYCDLLRAAGLPD